MSSKKITSNNKADASKRVVSKKTPVPKKEPGPRKMSAEKYLARCNNIAREFQSTITRLNTKLTLSFSQEINSRKSAAETRELMFKYLKEKYTICDENPFPEIFNSKEEIFISGNKNLDSIPKITEIKLDFINSCTPSLIESLIDIYSVDVFKLEMFVSQRQIDYLNGEIIFPEQIEKNTTELKLANLKSLLETTIGTKLSCLEIRSFYGKFHEKYHTYGPGTGNKVYIFNLSSCREMKIRKMIDEQILLDHHEKYDDGSHCPPYKYEESTISIPGFCIVEIDRQFLDECCFKFQNSYGVRVKRPSAKDMLEKNEIVSPSLARKIDSGQISANMKLATIGGPFNGFIITAY